uniref:Small integral membrane protein 19 n=1 Tax=Xenopus tropicalis TaxID=8364 RepID=A0A5S6L523_XENTR
PLLSAEEMDERRRQNIAYEYLCHLEEAKRWMEACLVEELPPTTELEEGLRNGVYLAKLGRFFAPKVISEKKIYDVDQTRFKVKCLKHMLNFDFYNNFIFFIMKYNVHYYVCLSLEEEISNMRKELEKYGIQMPSFNKIGGILANELSVDEAALHAAVIAINEALDKGVASQTMVTLRNPNAMLLNVEERFAEEYQNVLAQAKKIKEDNAKIKVARPQDVYEELLTQAEIQGHITKVNTNVALVQVNEAIDRKDEVALLNGLMLPILSLFEVQPKNSSWYLAQLCNTKEQKTQKAGAPSILDKNEIQKDVSVANKEAEAHVLMLEAVEKINAALLSGDSSQTLAALQLPEAQMPTVHPFAETLYHMELQSLQKQNPNYLTQEELFIAVEMLSAVALVNQALETNDFNAVQTHLASQAIGLNNLEEDNMQRYTGTLASLRKEALHQGQSYLGWTEIQKCIDGVNDEIQEENERIIAIGFINDAIVQGDPKSTLEALLAPQAKLLDVSQENACHYQDVLQQAKAQKCKVGVLSSCYVNRLHMASGVAEINLALEKDDAQQTLMALQCSKTRLKGVLPECSEVYHKDLCEAKTQKTTEGNITHSMKDKYDYYYNVETKEGCWAQPEGITPKHSWLTREEIQLVVGKITADYNREQLWMANENLIILLQAQIRGYLLRKAFNERKAYLHKQEPSAVKLQACWKGYKQRKSYTDRLKLLQANIVGIVKIQSWFRMLKARKEFQKRLQYFTDHVEIITIQAFLRANKAREDYRTLISSEEPPLNVVRKFVYLLDQSDLDFHEELEVTRLREEVVTKIRSNQQLEKDLNLMDIKIGLLVKNRITLQVISEHFSVLAIYNGKRLFCTLLIEFKCQDSVLQTNPTYLAKLIFQMPQNKSTKFMDTVIFTLYNYASNQREEYLLLKLFETALQEEIKSKVDQIQDIVTGNPTVIKMVVSFNRGARGQNTLRQLLAPVVKEIIEDKSLIINTSPVEVYKAWVNQLEMATGEASKLPYDVTTEQALSHPEVVSKLESSIQSLRVVTDKVLQSIFSSLDLIPYGMRYIAKVLKNSLHEKFPDATEDELLKIVGNLLYYRYMNPAIVAPDGFDIIDITAGGQIHSDQRRNLGSVAKVLQHAASNKLFDGENAHMSSMNPYLSQTYQKFRKFFQSACEVPEPEEKFNIDEFSDLVTLSKPVIYISIEEIINTHSLLLEHQDAISPDHNDILHELLEALGTVPDVESFLGKECGVISFHVPYRAAHYSSDFISKLIVDVIRTQSGETITEILETPASVPQENEHLMVIEKRAAFDAKTPDKMKRSHSVFEDGQLPLEQKKRKILRNLRTLEQAGLVTEESKYQEIINEIAKDIRNQRRYRQCRKAELVKLQQTLNALNSKTAFYQEQINYYNTYIKTCLDNLTRKRSIKFDGKAEEKGSKKTKQATLKYTAARLHEKGVILEIEGLQTNQFKNVLFDITPGDEVGDFEVKAKFLGVEMEKVQLHFQDLLQMQYDGVAVMKMFDKAKVNVNLLIFLLNRKFYGK